MEPDRKCSKCERPLNPEEGSLCPKCKADRTHFWVKVAGATASVAASVLVVILTGGRARGPRA